ncbi:MAG: fasciclin domain-containing protein [Balneolaceae bacterium]
MRSTQNKIFTGLVTVAITIFAFTGITQAQEGTQGDGDVVEVVKGSDDHSIFVGLLEDTELEGLLKQEGPYTVLAPTDEAFEKLENFEELKEDSERLQNIIIGHLYNGEISSADVENAKAVEISDGDIEASNGVVHVVEEVLLE